MHPRCIRTYEITLSKFFHVFLVFQGIPDGIAFLNQTLLQFPSFIGRRAKWWTNSKETHLDRHGISTANADTVIRGVHTTRT